MWILIAVTTWLKTPLMGVIGASLVAQAVKSLPAMLEDPGSISGSGRSREEGNGLPIPVSLPGKFRGQEEPEGLQSMKSQSLGGDALKKREKVMPCNRGLFENKSCLCISTCWVLVPATEQIINMCCIIDF